MGIENESTIQIGWREVEIATWSTAIEVFQREGNMVVRAKLPGLSKDAVKVEATDEGLVIRGERKEEPEDKREGRGLLRGEGFYRAELRLGARRLQQWALEITVSVQSVSNENYDFYLFSLTRGQ